MQPGDSPLFGEWQQVTRLYVSGQAVPVVEVALVSQTHRCLSVEVGPAQVHWIEVVIGQGYIVIVQCMF